MLSPAIKQLYASCSGICIFLAHGYLIGTVAMMLPSLRDSSNTMQLSMDQESWITSAVYLGMFPSQLVSGFFSDKFGRKIVVTISIIPLVISSVMIYVANEFTTLLIACLLIGLVGAGTALAPYMVAELCSPKIRGTILNTKVFFFTLGIVTSHVFSNIYNIKKLVLIVILPSALGAITAITSPESPAWLATQQRFDETKAAFTWLRGDNDSEELKELMKSQRLNYKLRLQEIENKTKVRQLLRFVYDKSFLKATIISFTSILLFVASGRMVFEVYIFDLIILITGDKDRTRLYALVLDILSITTNLISFIFIHRMNRRSLLLISCVLAIVVLFIFCVVSYLSAQSFISVKYSWVKGVLILGYILIRDIGFISVIMAVLCEIYPLNHRGVGVAIVGFMFSVLSFSVVKATPILLHLYDVHGAFLINIAVMSICVTHLYYFLPETDNKTLLNIENEMKGKEMNGVEPDETYPLSV